MTRADKIIRWIETRCIVPEGSLVRQPVRLADFQKDFIRDVYDSKTPVRTAILSVARKNAKTAIAAMLALVHIDGPEARQNSEIISGARSRDQAGIVFRYASKMVMMSPKLSARIKIIPSKKTLVGLAANVEYHALSAEAGTAHGLSPVLAILDEPGQVRGPTDDFFDALTTAQGAHDNPLKIYIGTQAARDSDLFSILIDDALSSQDPTVVCHLYAAADGCDVLDEAGWRAANPALGLFRSMAELQEQATQAHRMPSKENTFRNLILNQRVNLHNPAVSRDVWISNGGEPLPLRPGVPTYGGLDLSIRTDLTALVLTQYIDGCWHDHAFFWTPADTLAERARRDRTDYQLWVKQGHLIAIEGKTVDYRHVVSDMVDIVDELDLKAIAFDRYRIDIFKQAVEDLGVEWPLVPFGQGYKSMSPAWEQLEADLLNSRRRHGMHPVLTECAANAVIIQDPAGSKKLDKAKSTGRIDGMVALTMARGVVDTTVEEEDGMRVYEERGILVF